MLLKLAGLVSSDGFLLLKFLKNSQVRLLFSASLFTGAFVWMAVTAYDVNVEEIKVFLVMSVIVLGVVISAGLLFALIISLLRRARGSDGLLAEIEKIEKETAKQDQAGEKEKKPQ